MAVSESPASRVSKTPLGNITTPTDQSLDLSASRRNNPILIVAVMPNKSRPSTKKSPPPLKKNTTNKMATPKLRNSCEECRRRKRPCVKIRKNSSRCQYCSDWNLCCRFESSIQGQRNDLYPDGRAKVLKVCFEQSAPKSAPSPRWEMFPSHLIQRMNPLQPWSHQFKGRGMTSIPTAVRKCRRCVLSNRHPSQHLAPVGKCFPSHMIPN